MLRQLDEWASAPLSSGPCLVDDAASVTIQELYDDIYEALRAQEPHKMPNITMMDSQPEIKWSMRPRLLGFMMEAQSAFRLCQNTFALAVVIMDRYTSKRIVYNRHYQLVGCVSLWLAAKYLGNKHKVPSVTELAYLCANTFSNTMFREMEMHITTSLDWDLGAPTSIDFIDLMMERLHVLLGVPELPDREFHIAVARHISECGLFDRQVVSFPPSVVAASAIELSCLVMDSCNGVQKAPVKIPGSSRTCVETLVNVIGTCQNYVAGRHDQYRFNVPSTVTCFVSLGRVMDLYDLNDIQAPVAKFARSDYPNDACLTPGASDSEDSSLDMIPGAYAFQKRGDGPLEYGGHTQVALPPTPEDDPLLPRQYPAF